MLPSKATSVPGFKLFDQHAFSTGQPANYADEYLQALSSETNGKKRLTKGCAIPGPSVFQANKKAGSS
jgi:hypothetical protein